MNLNIHELMQRLIDLQIQAEKIDKTLKDIRIETNNIIWDLAEAIKNNKSLVVNLRGRKLEINSG
jgi:hypothetical protein